MGQQLNDVFLHTCLLLFLGYLLIVLLFLFKHFNFVNSLSEATVEVLPRLFKIKYESGTLEELLYVDMPREYQNSSGQIVLDYAKAIQESVFEQLRVVRDGQLRIVFSQDLKVVYQLILFFSVVLYLLSYSLFTILWSCLEHLTDMLLGILCSTSWRTYS